MENRSVFITGAATGIGLAIAQKLDRLGWTVFAGVNKTAPTELLQGASDRVTVMHVDVSDDQHVKEAAQRVSEAVGGEGLGLLINNAAMTGAPGPVETIDIGEFRRLMEVNFWGPIRVTQAFLPLLRRFGPARIIMVSSGSVYLTIPLGCSYPTSKQALGALTAHLRMELAPFGIEVTALEPGGVLTPMTAQPPEEERILWSSIPPDLRGLYDAAFTYPGKGIADGFEMESPETFAERVYEKIISARTLKPRYTLGKGVRLLPLMHRLLSDRALERVFRKLFQVKAKNRRSS
jgi:NAD(P)-dependent dehydrogenase (short-subunit alcohol dehydrogenase family)